MNHPLQFMYSEHAIIKKAADVIDQLDKGWEKDEEAYRSSVNHLVKFFREYADGFHHRKEEEILFPALMDHPDFMITDMIDSLMQHHDEFREYAQDIQHALQEKDFPASYALLRRYMRDLEDHISAEDDELFVLAEHLFSPAELDSLRFRCMDVDREIGDEKKSALEAWITDASAGK